MDYYKIITARDFTTQVAQRDWRKESSVRDFRKTTSRREFGHHRDTSNRATGAAAFTHWGQTNITLGEVLETYGELL